jgi:hypothetical protein
MASQTLSPIDHVVEPNAATAIDKLGVVMTNAGIGSTGVITGGAFNGTVGATSASTGAFTTLVASSGLDTTVIGANTPEAITGTTITANTAFSGPTTGVTSGAGAAAGKVGETIGDMVFGSGTTATITVTIAAPGVVTWTGHGFSTAIPQPVVFTTTGALPTGITSGTVYYTIPSTVTTNTFEIATTVANAYAGTAITTSGTQSGTQTGTAGCALANTTVADVTGLSLTAGDWDVWGEIVWTLGSTTTWTKLESSISQTTATLATPGTDRGTSYNLQAQISAAATNGTSTSILTQTYVNVSSTTTIFMPVKATFAISTANAAGFIMARRRR